MKGLEFWLLYLLPTFVALGMRSRNGAKVGLIFGLNLFLGWTVVVWLACMWLAVMGQKRIPFLADRIAAYQASQAASAPTGRAQQTWGSAPDPVGQTQQPVTCNTCGGRGQMTCPLCNGTRGQWVNPTTEHGVSQFVPCGRCGNSGGVQCMGCGGSGRSQY
jgi:hypothetical protein